MPLYTSAVREKELNDMKRNHYNHDSCSRSVTEPIDLELLSLDNIRISFKIMV